MVELVKEEFRFHPGERLKEREFSLEIGGDMIESFKPSQTPGA